MQISNDKLFGSVLQLAVEQATEHTERWTYLHADSGQTRGRSVPRVRRSGNLEGTAIGLLGLKTGETFGYWFDFGDA